MVDTLKIAWTGLNLLILIIMIALPVIALILLIKIYKIVGYIEKRLSFLEKSENPTLH